MAGMWKIPTFAEDQRERVRGWEARLDARALAEPVTDEPCKRCRGLKTLPQHSITNRVFLRVRCARCCGRGKEPVVRGLWHRFRLACLSEPIEV